MKNIYNISFSRLIASHLAGRIRNPKFIAYMLTLIYPLEELHSVFLSFANTLNTEVNSQICYMRAMLNDEFDFYDRRIQVRTINPDFDSILTWHIDTDKRTLVGSRGSGNECLRNAKGQLGKNISNFKIVFPKGFSLSESEMSRLIAMINNNKLASKKYSIVFE